MALLSWTVTVLAGATLFGIWLSRGGLRRQGPAASRFPPALIFGHPVLAVTGLVISIISVASDTDALRWVALAILVVLSLGQAMNNLRHGEEPQAVTLPAVLAVLSLSGLVACWAVLARRRQPQAGGLAVAVAPAAAVFVVGVLLGFAVAYPEAPRPAGGRWWPSRPQRRLFHHPPGCACRAGDGGVDQP